MNQRQREIQRSLALLGNERLTTFICALAVRESRPLAVHLLKDALDQGENLEAALLGAIKLPVDRNDEGFLLEVTQRSDNSYRIALGYIAGHLAGDGGEWQAVFDAEGRVVTVVEEQRWLA